MANRTNHNPGRFDFARELAELDAAARARTAPKPITNAGKATTDLVAAVMSWDTHEFDKIVRGCEAGGVVTSVLNRALEQLRDDGTIYTYVDMFREALERNGSVSCPELPE